MISDKAIKQISVHKEEAIKKFFEEISAPKFRVTQFFQSLYKNIASDFEEFTTFSKDMRELFEKRISFCSLEEVIVQESKKDDTVKFLFKTKDNFKIEAVLMRHLKGRNTLCISSQVGCAMACKFCATGRLGFTKNLSTEEIVDQVLLVDRYLKKKEQKVTNIVFMGMGEPFLNMNDVFKSIDVFCGEKKLNLSTRHVTISTCGIVPGIEKLIKSKYKVNLAISLHSADEDTRNDLMPVNKRYPLKKLMDSLYKYVKVTKKRVFYEYILIKGITDTEDQAKKLGKLLRNKLAHVNLIPYNRANNKDIFESTDKVNIYKFKSILDRYSVTSSVRFTLGEDIDAACGQLAAKEMQNAKSKI